MRLLGCVLALALLGACAFTEDQVAISYIAPPNLDVAPGAAEVLVAVDGLDGRVSNKDRVSSKKNGYGIETARITAANDVVDLVRTAVEQELESLGFKTGPGGLSVKVELQTFYNDFKNGFFSGDAIAEVAFNLTATRADGSFLYSRSYKGIGMNKNIQLASGSNAQPALQEALTNAMAQLIQDETLRKALLAGAGKSPARPQSMVPLILENVPGM